ncbi:DUF5677 domain-containing protein [Aeromonas hydrophila]|uniref:DUF5677 domain-containing protein n=1 Tax=Aeromonas hydrophila TaxID=644 RepID=UPI00191D1F3B|nr:DUF5677 domain-containing protein [Aeromonas hydrophila]MBL0559906.1 hypothetical protein [Aeromonas hydrophila]
MNNLVKSFIKKRSLSIDMDLFPPLYSSILLLEQAHQWVFITINENIDRLSLNAPFAPMFDMYERNYEYCSGAISLLLLSQFSSAEALCRTAIEGAINLEFVSVGDPMANQIAYYKSYIETERKQNKSWRESINKSNASQEEKEFHYNKINDKEDALSHYEYGLRQSLYFEGIDYDANQLKWPNIFERFQKLGKEIEYRTLYTALCSQAHNDAEDIINKIMARITENVKGMDKAQEMEQYLLSVFYILSAVRYHIYGAAMFVAKFKIDAVELMQIHKKVMDELEYLAENLVSMVQEHLTIEEPLKNT